MVRVSDVTKVYQLDGVDVPALRGVTAEIHRGKMVAIMGPSGSGKSTLLHIMGGIDLPTSGEVWVDDQNMTALTDRERTVLRRRKIGLIFQSFNLLPMLSVLENVILPLQLNRVETSQARDRAREVLDVVKMSHRLQHRVSQLSGGEQQRAAIARALVIKPTILLGDEPTGNLDTANGRDLTLLLRQMVQDQSQTIVVVTHDPRVAACADRLIEIQDGRIKYDGVPEDAGLNPDFLNFARSQ